MFNSRYSLYRTGFIFAFIVNFIFNNVQIIGTITFIVYVLWSIYYVFNFEDLPKKQYSIKPQSLDYSIPKTSNYGSIVGLAFAFVAFCFYLATSYFKASLGFSTILAWFISLVLFYIVLKRFGKTIHPSVYYVQVKTNFKYSLQTLKEINEMLLLQNEEALNGIKKQIGEDSFNEVSNHFYTFYNSTKESLTNEEVKELNNRL